MIAYDFKMEIYKFINKFGVERAMKLRGEKGQITIFIIIAIVIVVAAILFFALTDTGKGIISPIISGGASESFNIQEEFSRCVLDSEEIDSEINKILSQGGKSEPDFFYLHDGNPYSYLCHSSEFYEPCINNNPLLLQSIEREIDTAISSMVGACLSDLQEELRDRGFTVNTRDFDVVIDVVEGRVDINMDTVLSVRKGSTSQTIEGLEVRKPSEIYQLISIGSSIINFESVYGDSDPVAYMAIYPSTKIQKLKQSDGTTLYEISDRNTLESFNFATRSYALPPGYGL